LANREPTKIAFEDGKALRVRRLLPPALTEVDRATEDAIASVLLTPYRALALAVQEAHRNFVTYAQIAALAQPTVVRRQAEDLARNELVRAASLRRARRRAYHAERPSDLPAPTTLAEFRLSAAAWEAETSGPDQARRLEEVFEKYLSVAEHATDEAVLVEAQARAVDVLRRMLAAKTTS
jgi:hypothetical protein